MIYICYLIFVIYKQQNRYYMYIEIKMQLQIKKIIVVCGVASGLVVSAYSILRYFRSLWCRGQNDRLSKNQNTAQKNPDNNKMLKSIYSAKPLRMWIDGKCFNIKQFKRKTKKTQHKTIIQAEFKNQTVSDGIEIGDIEYKNEIDIITNDNGKLSLSFQLPSIYYIKLHQWKEFDINHLSNKTHTIISWPRHGETGIFRIEGNDIKSVEHAVREIHSVIGAIRDNFTAAQFISVPILSSEVKTNFEKFKAEILKEQDIKGMHESIFQSPLKLHLTVVVFALSDDTEKSEAIKALEEYKTTVLCPLLQKTGPLRLRVEGIDCMQSNYEKTDVLYANVKTINETEEANLQKIVNDLANYFYERGLVLRHTENVKLHMTLINSKYRKNPENPSPRHRRWVKRESFDASSIMKKYKDFVFGECDLDSIHLSLISSKGDDGFYKPLSIINL